MGFCLEYIQLNTLSWIYVFIQTPLLLHCTDKRLCRRSSLQVPIEIVVIRPYFWDTNIDLTMSREQNTSERPQQKQVNYDPRLSALLLSPHSQSFFSNIYCDALYYVASQIKSLYGRCCYVLFLMHWKLISDLEIFELFFRKILIAPEFIFSYGSSTLFIIHFYSFKCVENRYLMWLQNNALKTMLKYYFFSHFMWEFHEPSPQYFPLILF